MKYHEKKNLIIDVFATIDCGGGPTLDPTV
jgi:hypothetical protein